MNGKTGADADLMAIAKRELGAFIMAVTELFDDEKSCVKEQVSP